MSPFDVFFCECSITVFPPQLTPPPNPNRAGQYSAYAPGAGAHHHLASGPATLQHGHHHLATASRHQQQASMLGTLGRNQHMMGHAGAAGGVAAGGGHGGSVV